MSYLHLHASGEHKALKDKIVKAEDRARKLVYGVDKFSLADFKMRFLRLPTDGVNVFYHFEQKVAYLGGFTSFLHFTDVTAAYLQEYEDYKLDSDLGSA